MTSHSGCQKPYAEKTHHSILYLREYVLTVGAGKTPSNRFVNEDKCFYFILSQATHPPFQTQPQYQSRVQRNRAEGALAGRAN